MYKLTAPLMTLYFFVSAKIEDRKEDGAVAVEYVLLVVSIALIMAVGAAVLGGKISAKFSGILP